MLLLHNNRPLGVHTSWLFRFVLPKITLEQSRHWLFSGSAGLPFFPLEMNARLHRIFYNA
jgi:hypothetical protein